MSNVITGEQIAAMMRTNAAFASAVTNRSVENMQTILQECGFSFTEKEAQIAILVAENRGNSYETTAVSVEFSVAWIKENPELFASKYRDFFDTYWPQYSIHSKANKGFITLVAKKAT